MKIAYIEWTDATASSSTWELSEIKDRGLCHFLTAGVLVQETPEYVVIAQDWSEEEKRGRAIEWIPRTGITLLKVLDMEAA